MGSEFQARGLFIPPEILSRDLSAGTATDGAELVADNLLAGSFIDVLRNSLTIRQAGAQIIPGLVGNVDIPRQTSGAGAVWISAEDGDATESDPQFDQVSLTPKDLAAYTEVTRRLRMQSSIGIEALIRNDLVVAAATAIDLAGLYGSGASGQPTGVANQTGINTFSLAAADPTYAETVRMVKEVMTDNALMGSLGYIIDPNGWEAATTTEKFSGTGKTILSENGTINGYQAAVTNQVTAEDWFFGNWADLLIGMWGGVEINVDPFTHSLKGKTRYVMFQTIDTAVRHPVSFCHCNDA
ncbi:MAG: phage major capsid protein [Gammaproteobacteria bacterium]|nr:phage major capsid protein [Gammaproteobacteria bacterium]